MQSSAATPSQTASQAVHDSLMDSSQHNLLAVRQKVDDLHSSLNDIIVALQNISQPIIWPDVLAKFMVVNLQFSNLMQQLRPILKYSVVHPKLVDSAELSLVLPLQLSTFPLPEMQQEETSLKADLHSTLNKHNPGVAYEQALSKLEAHNATIQQLMATSQTDPDSGVMDPQGSLIRSLKAKSRSITAQVNDLTAKRAAALHPTSGSAAGGPAKGGRGRAAAQAKRKREVGDDVINMFLTGEGLKSRQ